MEQTIPLSGLREGERGKVLSVAPELSRTLERLGLVSGTEIVCLRRSPLGDPTAYWFRGAVIALRADSTEKIPVVRLPETASSCPHR